MEKKNYIIETKTNKYRGLIENDLLYFKGICYGKAERFHKATCPENDSDIIDCTEYGYACLSLNDANINRFPYILRNHYLQNEDCLNLNIVAPLTETRKKPVLVYLHGGKYEEGSAVSNGFVDPRKIVKENDIVCVSVNHRLNILGLLDVSQFGDEYKDSGMLMIQDIILALKWIRENIVYFDGDPDNITLMGNSGGGGKIIALMQSKDADGLFHKAVISSGVLDTLIPDNNNSSEKIIQLLFDKLHISSIQELQTIDYNRLKDAYNQAITEIEISDYKGCCFKKNEYYRGSFLENGLRKENNHIPILIGTTYSELDFFKHMNLSEEKALELLKDKYKENFEAIRNIYTDTYPNKEICDLLNLDSIFRDAAVRFIKEAVKSGFTVYNYLFDIDYRNYHKTPSYHMSDLPYFFKTCDKSPVFSSLNGFEKTAESASRTLADFMKTGKCDWKKCNDDIYTRVYTEDGYNDVSNYDIKLLEMVRAL